ncbi:GNAT family N-acetyltransferase [Lacinutrix sp. C3R15]|uniref:GNAT family N-acetyltransferase n=1 Tax=Flavobacteriaceae TaxID=49546 RepID=UPI001C0858F3|nr:MULTISPECIES: GNAT family N-acetyltransferase [Flavobacteriaceae]MBU2938022.1 GNAT family N-acetyltransferase [Lacinutrix sp. C3R15]MDO6621336.1 GNAT family N-acetyltransferase [Oceanihabitans sp. 1_MG-2023]
MIHFKLFNTIEELPDSWNALPTQDIFLKTPFLKALEQSSPSNITSYYLAVFKDQKLVGIAILQRVKLYTNDIFRKTSTNFFKVLAKKAIAKIVKGNMLVVGNLMHTGQHGFFFLKDEILQETFLNQIQDAITYLRVVIKKKHHKKIRIIAFKDYFESDTIHQNEEYFNKVNLYKVQVQPNMLFVIPKEWHTKEEYIAAFTKKYRDRFKRARKKSNALQLQELDLEAIGKYANTLFNLYECVSDNAGINTFKLANNHFYSLKSHLKEDFKVFGYFLNNELIGFYTLIANNNTLETYFLGYHPKLQHQYQMYLNMLYNMAIFGIENNFKTIVFARTAMEIKSSIGAKPQTMHIYLKHTNNFIANTVLKLIVKYMNPIRDWQERHPFK